MIAVLLAALPALTVATYTHDLNCRADFTNAWRYTVANNVNTYRELIANGSAPNKCGPLPAAKNMYKVLYSCDIETQLYAYTSSCGGTPMPSNSFVMMYFQSTVATEAQAMSSLVNMLTTDINQAVTVGVDASATYTSTVANWARHASGQRTAVACSFNPSCASGNVNWPYKLTIACAYDKPVQTTGPVYQVGTKCAADADCTTYEGSVCETSTGLCTYKWIDNGANTMCPDSTALTDKERQYVLDWHNKFRSSAAKGLEPDGIAAGAFAPQAKRMTKMKYNCAVEKSAAIWANNCVYQHSTSANRSGNGENLYMTSDKTQLIPDSLEMASKLWWKELADFGVGPENNLTQAVWDRGVGHYTQMAWQKTTSLGCASVHCSSMTFVVCQYSPAGNMMNTLIYEVGPTCQTDADCGTGTCSVAEALCIV